VCIQSFEATTHLPCTSTQSIKVLLYIHLYLGRPSSLFPLDLPIRKLRNFFVSSFLGHDSQIPPFLIWPDEFKLCVYQLRVFGCLDYTTERNNTFSQSFIYLGKYQVIDLMSNTTQLFIFVMCLFIIVELYFKKLIYWSMISQNHRHLCL